MPLYSQKFGKKNSHNVLHSWDVGNYYTNYVKNDILASSLSNLNKIRITLITEILYIKYKVVTLVQYQ